MRNVLILLPPSEGKSSPPVGPRLDLSALSFPTLTATRRRVLTALVRLCRGSADTAAGVLGLGPTQLGEIATDARLRSAPCAPAIDVYSGVLFDALDPGALSPSARRQMDDRVVIASALWGLVRPSDPIPAYRLSGSASLPELGTIARTWRDVLPPVIESRDGLIVDLRSSAYVSLGPLPRAVAARAATVRVLQEHDGRRTVVSHSNKATKGRIARSLVQGRRAVGGVDDLADMLVDAGFRIELAHEQGSPAIVDVIVDRP